MRRQDIIRRLLEKIRGFKEGDYVEFWWDAVKQRGCGEIVYIVQLHSNLGFGYVVKEEKTSKRVLIIPKLGDKIHLKELEREVIEEKQDSKETP